MIWSLPSVQPDFNIFFAQIIDYIPSIQLLITVVTDDLKPPRLSSQTLQSYFCTNIHRFNPVHPKIQLQHPFCRWFEDCRLSRRTLKLFFYNSLTKFNWSNYSVTAPLLRMIWSLPFVQPDFSIFILHKIVIDFFLFFQL